jgi:hypothetical protein
MLRSPPLQRFSSCTPSPDSQQAHWDTFDGRTLSLLAACRTPREVRRWISTGFLCYGFHPRRRRWQVTVWIDPEFDRGRSRFGDPGLACPVPNEDMYVRSANVCIEAR